MQITNQGAPIAKRRRTHRAKPLVPSGKITEPRAKRPNSGGDYSKWEG